MDIKANITNVNVSNNVVSNSKNINFTDSVKPTDKFIRVGNKTIKKLSQLPDKVTNNPPEIVGLKILSGPEESPNFDKNCYLYEMTIKLPNGKLVKTIIDDSKIGQNCHGYTLEHYFKLQIKKGLKIENPNNVPFARSPELVKDTMTVGNILDYPKFFCNLANDLGQLEFSKPGLLDENEPGYEYNLQTRISESIEFLENLKLKKNGKKYCLVIKGGSMAKTYVDNTFYHTTGIPPEFLQNDKEFQENYQKDIQVYENILEEEGFDKHAVNAHSMIIWYDKKEKIWMASDSAGTYEDITSSLSERLKAFMKFDESYRNPPYSLFDNRGLIVYEKNY